MKIDVGSAVSLEGLILSTVFCRGFIKEMYKVGDDTLATTDGVYYFHICGRDGYRVVPEESAQQDTFNTPFKRIQCLTYLALGDEGDADIYIKIDENAMSGLESDIVYSWNKMFKGSEIKPDVENGTLDIICADDEADAVTELVTDKKNVFSRFNYTFDNTTYHFNVSSRGSLLNKFESLEDIANYLDELVDCNFRIEPEDVLVNLNNVGRRSFQWEVWSMCNNLCSYCYLGKENRHTDKERQMKSLTDLHMALDNLDYRIYNNVSLIGGDFFQGQIDEPEVHDSFMDIIEKIAKAYHDNKLGSVWITCTLTLGDQHHLYEMLEIFKKYECFPREEYGSSGIWLCTSWDIKGRFHTEDRLKNWDYHMLNVQKNYPWVKFNTTIILMEPFCQAVIDGIWSPREFSEKYKTSLFFKQVGLGKIAEEVDVGDDSQSEIEKYNKTKVATNDVLGFTFCPHRHVMLECLRKFAIDYPEFYDRLYNIKYRADELHRNFNDTMGDMATRRNKNSANETDVVMENSLNTCGHMINYMAYIDSSKCCICDKKMIWDIIHGGL